jgi:hypothetical protein
MTNPQDSLSAKLLENPFREDFSPSELKILEAEEAERLSRHKRVGALLREMHYLATSKPPRLLHLEPNEEAYWTGYATMYPGLEETKVQAELTRRKSASSTAAATS